MAFFVAIHQEAWPDRLDHLLGVIRQNLASAPVLHPGRRTTRLFQRFGRPTHLLAVSEWSDEQAFEQFRQSQAFEDTNTGVGPPPTIEPLVPLRRFERMEQRVVLASCVTVTAPPGRDAKIRDHLLHDAHENVRTLSGLVSREVYTARHTPGRFLVVRSWTSLADLERFRETDAAELDRTYEKHGARIDRFTGALAAEFSVLHL